MYRGRSAITNCNEQAATTTPERATTRASPAMPEVDQVFIPKDAQEPSTGPRAVPGAAHRRHRAGRRHPRASGSNSGPDPSSPSSPASSRGAPGVAERPGPGEGPQEVLPDASTVSPSLALGLASLAAVCAALLMATTIRAGGLRRTPRSSIMRLARRCQQLDDPDALHHRDAHRVPIGVALAVGMLWGAIQVIFSLGVSQVASAGRGSAPATCSSSRPGSSVWWPSSRSSPRCSPCAATCASESRRDPLRASLTPQPVCRCALPSRLCGVAVVAALFSRSPWLPMSGADDPDAQKRSVDSALGQLREDLTTPRAGTGRGMPRPEETEARIPGAQAALTAAEGNSRQPGRRCQAAADLKLAQANEEGRGPTGRHQ